MKKWIILLALIAAVQILLIVVSRQGGRELLSQPGRTPMFNFSRDDVDHILIKGKDGLLELSRESGTWCLNDGSAADQEMVADMIDKLLGLRQDLPVATSETALKRFKVAEGEYERFVQLRKGSEVLGELYLGTGAGARRSHVRNGERQGVYTAVIGSYELPVAENRWQDTRVLRLDEKTVNMVELGRVVLKRDPDENGKEGEGGWHIVSGTAAALAHKNIDKCVKLISDLEFTKVLGRDGRNEYGLEAPVLELTLGHGESKRGYIFGIMQDEYVVKVSDREEYFQVAAYNGKELIESCDMKKWMTSENDEPAVTTKNYGDM